MVWPFRRRRGGEETRAITSVPWDVGGLSQAAVGQSRALQLTPVFSATSLIASDVSTLPVCGYRRVGGVSRPMRTLPVLFADLVSSGRFAPWMHRAMTSLLLRGNAYGLVLARDGFGFPTRVEWLDPDDVTVIDTAPSGPGSFLLPLWYWRGRAVPVEDMVHVPWYALPWRVQGMSPIASFARTIGVGLSIVDYGATWFEGGGFPPGTFRNTEVEVDQQTAEAVGARLDVARRRRRPLVFGKDWEYQPISVPPNEAQFIEAAQLNATTIASIYHVPPEWVGGSAGGGTLHYSSEEQYQAHYVAHGVRPWVELLESVFAGILPANQYVKLDMDVLLRADLKTRHEVYALDAGIGLRTIDEMRAAENWPPKPADPAPPDPAPAPGDVDPAARMFGSDATVDLARRRAAWNGTR